MIRLIMLGAILAAAGTAAWLGGRDWRMTSMPHVTRIAGIPAGADRARLEDFLDFGAFLPRQRPQGPRRRATEIPELIEPTPAALGYSYREFSAFGLPLWASREIGIVLYREGANGYQVVPLDEEYLDLLAAETGGRHLEEGYVFPFWKFIWGWAFVAALLVWLFFQFRAEARRRREEGIICPRRLERGASGEGQ